MKYLRIIDSFSKKPSLLLNGHRRNFNKIGIFFGVLLLYIGIMVALIISTFLVLQKKKINILYNIQSEYTNFIDFNDVQFSLIVTNNNGIEFKNADRLFDLKSNYMKYKIQNNTPKLDVKPINLNECNDNSNKTGAHNDSLLIKAYKNSARCLSFKDNNITLQGNERNSIDSFSLINFYLNKCMNTTKKIDCFPDEIIDKQLNDLKITMSIGDYDVNTLNNTNPLLEIRRSFIMQFSSTVHSKHYFEVNNI
jgi:hypothetical protein